MATDTFSGWLLGLKIFIGHFAVFLEMRYLLSFFNMFVNAYFVLLVSFSYFLHLLKICTTTTTIGKGEGFSLCVLFPYIYINSLRLWMIDICTVPSFENGLFKVRLKHTPSYTFYILRLQYFHMFSLVKT